MEGHEFDSGIGLTPARPFPAAELSLASLAGVLDTRAAVALAESAGATEARIRLIRSLSAGGGLRYSVGEVLASGSRDPACEQVSGASGDEATVYRLGSLIVAVRPSPVAESRDDFLMQDGGVPLARAAMGGHSDAAAEAYRLGVVVAHPFSAMGERHDLHGTVTEFIPLGLASVRAVGPSGSVSVEAVVDTSPTGSMTVVEKALQEACASGTPESWVDRSAVRWGEAGQ